MELHVLQWHIDKQIASCIFIVGLQQSATPPGIGATIHIGWEIQCLPYVGYMKLKRPINKKNICKYIYRYTMKQHIQHMHLLLQWYGPFCEFMNLGADLWNGYVKAGKWWGQTVLFIYVFIYGGSSFV